MKRVLRLALVAAMAISCALPVSADSAADQWLNLFGGYAESVYGAVDFSSMTTEEQAAYYYYYSQEEETADVEMDMSYLEGASEWAEEEIFYAYNLGLLSGMDDLLCDYDTPITRLEFCQLVVSAYKSMGGYSISCLNPFTDTANPDVVTAYALGIVTGTTDTTFDPDATITREDLAVMLYRAVKIFIVPQITTDVSSYEDSDEIYDYALDAVTYLNQIGAMNGYSETQMAPKETVTREQAILMAYRTLQNYK